MGERRYYNIFVPSEYDSPAFNAVTAGLQTCKQSIASYRSPGIEVSAASNLCGTALLSAIGIGTSHATSTAPTSVRATICNPGLPFEDCRTLHGRGRGRGKARSAQALASNASFASTRNAYLKDQAHYVGEHVTWPPSNGSTRRASFCNKYRSTRFPSSSFCTYTQL